MDYFAPLYNLVHKATLIPINLVFCTKLLNGEGQITLATIAVKKEGKNWSQL